MTCDNIPVGSFRMLRFAKEWNFKIILRNPNYTRSNGLAEKAVSPAKNIVKKS